MSSVRSILKKTYSCFEKSTLGFMEGNQRIRRFKSDAKGCPGYRDTSRHFETKEEEEKFNEVKFGRYLLTRFEIPDYGKIYQQLARDLMDEEYWQKYGPPPELTKTPSEIEYLKQLDEAMERQKEVEYEIDDKRLEEEVEEIIRSGDLSVERLRCRKIQ
ncbi:hypothetical protein C5167_042692 [Papaver somniferum]|uniref:Uncharacterized protein n=1 Tax=Papaver somniferum TaxID=3469 RepID=A0A4Y7L4K6_PAPSO|nr:uncharacterized protein LOC113316841 [Papaver somniferum]RZC80116.1 hypothetical protein C5167_042692 [Papaver somniferum]